MSQSSPYTAASDWEKLSSEFAAWLPLIAPYGDRLIEAAAPKDGDIVLDLACGTGEPGLTLARRMPGITVIGADGAHGMAHAAAGTAHTEGLNNARQLVSRGESLPFANSAFDGVICRFGLMLFDDPAAGLAEIFRMVKPEGRVALSVWAGPDTVLCPALTLRVLERFTDDLEWPRTFALSEPGLAARMLETAGFTEVSETAFNPGFTFDGLDHFMERNLTGRFIEKPYARMGEKKQAEFRTAMRQAATAHALPDGRIKLAQEAILLSAVRP
ncbi:MAG: class I SAM-dependent methyltransferase [Leptospirillia bacterium]